MTISILFKVLEYAGAGLGLGAFAMNVLGITHPRAPLYLLITLSSCAFLTAAAFRMQAYGFLLIDLVWAVVTGSILFKVLRTS